MRSGTVNSTLIRGYGTLGGLGIIGAAIFAVPSTLLLDPLPPAEAYLSTIAALTTGFVCIALPWERLNGRWLHVFGVLATVEAAWAVAVFGPAYLAFFFLIAVAIAYVTPDAKSLLSHLVLIGLALLAPVVYGPEDARSTVQMALVVLPLLTLTAGLFAYLRQRMVADHRSYRRFAEETLALADRIAGHTQTQTPQRPVRAGEADDLPDWSRFRVSGRAATVAAAILATPLLSAGLAAAGVKLPGFAADTFADVGIELPNQDRARESASAATLEAVAPTARKPRRAERSEPAANPVEAGGDQPAKEDPVQDNEPGAGRSVTSDERIGGAVGAAEEPVATAPPEPQAGGSPDDPASGVVGGDPSGEGTLGQALEDTLDGLGGLLGLQSGESAEKAPVAETSAE